MKTGSSATPVTFAVQMSRKNASKNWHVACSRDGMTPIKSFRDLEVWQVGMELNDLIIKTVRKLPRDEFDLKRQMRKASLSIPANVAEGWRRKKRRGAYQNHVSIAMGSQGELETELESCFRNDFLNRKESDLAVELCDRVGAMLYRLHDSLD